MTNYATRIVDGIFGGSRQMARDLTTDPKKPFPPSTVQSWKDKRIIPSQHHALILRRGLELNKNIGPEDFFDLPDAPRAAHVKSTSASTNEAAE